MTESYTEWAVLTGGACSGKSTLANYFQADGQEVIPEAAQQYIEAGNSKDMPPGILQQYGTNGPIPHLDLQMESRRDPDEPVLLDRSLGDSLAFMEFLGDGAPRDLVEEASNRYDTVFHLDRVVEEEPDKTRTDDLELSHQVDQYLGEFYEETLDYDVIQVSEGSLEERADTVAEHSQLKKPDLEFEFPNAL